MQNISLDLKEKLISGDFLMKNTWIHRIEFHSEEQLVRGLQSCKYTKNNVKQNFKNSS